MKKYAVYALIDASKYLGEVEANSKEEAEDLAFKNNEIMDKAYVSVCHECANKVEIGDMVKLIIDEVEDK